MDILVEHIKGWSSHYWDWEVGNWLLCQIKGENVKRNKAKLHVVQCVLAMFAAVLCLRVTSLEML